MKQLYFQSPLRVVIVSYCSYILFSVAAVTNLPIVEMYSSTVLEATTPKWADVKVWAGL